MIAGYELAGTGAASPAAGANHVELRAPTRRLKVREAGLFSQAATTGRQVLGRPAAAGVTPTSPLTVQAQDTAEVAGTGQTAVAWGTAPTAIATPMRQLDFNNVIGSGVIFTWPSDGELIVPITGVISICWQAVTIAGPTCSFYFVVGE